jgi:hypothetical protein
LLCLEPGRVQNRGYMNPHAISSYVPWLPIELFQHGEVLTEAGFAIPLQPILGVNNAQSIKYSNYGEAGVQLRSSNTFIAAFAQTTNFHQCVEMEILVVLLRCVKNHHLFSV